MDIIGLGRDYYVVALFILYVTVGRVSLTVAVLFSLGSLPACITIVLGLEFLQIPLLYNFYSAINRFFQKLKKKLFRKKNEETPAEEGEVKEGFFVRKFRKYGNGGIFALASLPLKGCGVWSSLLLGRGLNVGKTKLYFIVMTGATVGTLSMVLFGFLFNKTALSLINSLNINPEIRSLFEGG